MASRTKGSSHRGLKVATIGGFGHLGRVLGELDAAGEEFRVAAMAKSPAGEDPHSYQSAHASARDSGDIQDDHRRMLHEMRPDVAVISTRLDLLASLAVEAAQLGCHVICEKPLALDHESLRNLWDACRRSGVQCVGILDNHVQPALVAARDAAQRGELGRVAIVNARKSYKWGNRPEWFGHRAQYGGTIPWVGIHALDYVYEITSQPFRTIFATHSNVAHPERPQCEDVAAMMMTLADGTHATASLDLLRPAAADTHGDDWVRVVGSAGVLEANMTLNTCRLTTASQPAHFLPLTPRQPAFVPLLRSIADGTVGREPSPEMRRAFLLTHASLCARDAADRGTVVHVEPFQMP